MTANVRELCGGDVVGGSGVRQAGRPGNFALFVLETTRKPFILFDGALRDPVVILLVAPTSKACVCLFAIEKRIKA